MKKILLVCSFVLGVSAVSFAQGGGRMPKPEDQAKKMQAELKLSDDQTAKVTTVLQAQAKSMDSLRTAASGDKDAMRKAMGPVRQATKAKLKAILTPEQQEAYTKLMADRMKKGGQGGGGAAPAEK